MDIIKRLQLNRNPKDIKSGSIIGAKNIMLDPISSSITNEYGFKEAFDTSNITNHPELSSYEIKGCIPCNEEVVIFLYRNADALNNISEDSKIIRLKDNGDVIIVPCTWKWEGGKVIGTFAYNYKKELIVAVSEINTINDVPLKIWNLNTSTALDTVTYKLEEDIPTFKANYAIDENGNLICGTYTYFIRFVISEDNYTKWFQLTDDIIIINPEIKEKPVHRYLGKDSQNADKIQTAITNDFTNVFVNNNSVQSNRRIHINLSIENNIFNNFQIGYIVKRNNESFGRLFGEFSIGTTTITIFDNNYLEEVNIDDFLEEPHQFFNVKNLINYNNRLYLSNYTEYKNENYNELVNSLVLKCNVIKTENCDNTIKYRVGAVLSAQAENINNNNVIMYATPITGTLNKTQSYQLLNTFGIINAIRNFYYSVESWVSTGLANLYYNGGTTEQVSHYLLQTGDCYIYDRTDPSVKIPLYTRNYNDILTDYVPFASFTYQEQDWDINIEVNSDLEFILVFTTNGNTTRINLKNASLNIEFWTRITEDFYDPDHQDYDHCNIYQWFGWYYTENNGANAGIGTSGLLAQNRYNATNPPYFSLQQTIIYDKIKNIGGLYNNTRTLIPGQVYNFYIHFIRKDLSVTNGYRINNNGQTNIFEVDGSNLTTDTNISFDFAKYTIGNKDYFRCPCLKYLEDDTQIGLNYDYLFVPDCSIPSTNLETAGFIGYFISYEKLDICSKAITPVEDIDNLHTKYAIDNTDMIYDNKLISGNKIFRALSTDPNDIDSSNNELSDKQIYTLPYREKNVEIEVALPLNGIINSTNPKHRYIIISDNTNIYNNKVKTLYQLTPFIFNIGETNTRNDLTSAYMFLPGFYNYQKIIHLSDELMFNAVSTYVYKKDGTKHNSTYDIKSYFYKHYSENPTNAYSIKEDYEKGAVTLQSNVYNNTVLPPSKINDFLELKQAYKTNPLKSYTNFSENYQDNFNKTIYRSDVISDESLKNGFRHFNIENYKNILENKGNIVNIVGVGLYLLVHTEYSLFVFDRNNQLSDKAQLQIPDTFDIDYKELTPSGEGFGGLKYKEESILTKQGYIWFDRITKSIFIFTGQDIKPLSVDIHNLLKYYFEIETDYQIRFAEDYYSNRLLITIKNDNNYITLSYSFDTNTFISAHDYTFDENYKTYNNSYIFSEKHPNKLFVFDKQSVDYKNLDKNRTSLLTKLVDNSNLCSYVDIIFTDNYELPKTLNSISYVMSRNNDFSNLTDIIDQYFNTDYDNKEHLNKIRLYSGFKLYITTDLVFSGELDIEQGEIINKVNSSGYSNKPHWRNGIWEFNEFRENLSKAVTLDELAKQNLVSTEGGETKKHQIVNVYDKKRAIYQNGYDKSDMRSLIVGKYFIFRFVFERKKTENQNDLNLKFETLDINTSR